MQRTRVYDPETGEPFDVPTAKANELILEKGWLQHPLDPHAEPAVKNVAKKPADGGSTAAPAKDVETPPAS